MNHAIQPVTENLEVSGMSPAPFSVSVGGLGMSPDHPEPSEMSPGVYCVSSIQPKSCTIDSHRVPALWLDVLEVFMELYWAIEISDSHFTMVDPITKMRSRLVPSASESYEIAKGG